MGGGGVIQVSVFQVVWVDIFICTRWGGCTCVNKCVRPRLRVNITFLPSRDAQQKRNPASLRASCPVMLHLTYTSSRLNYV